MNFASEEGRRDNPRSDRKIVLGLGSGRCGTRSLATFLNKQHDANVTHEQEPLLDWQTNDHFGRIQRRIDRICSKRKQGTVGDVASFYLPYASAILEHDDRVVMVCMKRDREETIRSFLEWIKRVHPLPTDHWSETPSPGFFRDPIWSRIFPKYKAESREEAIGRYWDEYYAVAEELAATHPDRFAIFDTRELNSEEGQERILRFCGLVEGQVLAPGLLKNRSSKEPTQYGPASFSSDGLDPKRCVVIVPHGGNIVPACERGLRELELLGYEVRRVGGYAAIDQGRNQMATDALVDGYEETMWIDSDVVFDPASVLELRRHQLPICCGIYSQKGKQALSSHIVPGTERLRFGREGGVTEILYAAAGFLHIRREVYQTVQEKLALPVCNEKFGRPMLPFFAPMIIPANEASWYLAEDFAFCERARQCGYSIFADTRIRLWHVGSYMYGWEDSGGKMPRHDDYTLTFGKASPEKDGVSQYEQGESA